MRIFIQQAVNLTLYSAFWAIKLQPVQCHGMSERLNVF